MCSVANLGGKISQYAEHVSELMTVLRSFLSIGMPVKNARETRKKFWEPMTRFPGSQISFGNPAQTLSVVVKMLICKETFK